MRKVASLLWFVLVFVLTFPIFTFPQTASAQSDPPLLLRFPTVSKTQIVFNYAGDLWTVSRDGGDARRLTSGTGVETLPHFSPDGSMMAILNDRKVSVYRVPVQSNPVQPKQRRDQGVSTVEKHFQKE